MTVSVVICTRDRPDDLADCLASLARQTRRPHEVIVVDASDGDASAVRVRTWAARSEIPVDCLRTAPGLTRQRNLGAARARGDVVTFLDDDVVLDPGYLEAIAALFEAAPGLGGAEGTVAFPPLRGRRRLANACRRFFLMNALGPRRGVRRSGFATYDPWPRGVRFTNCLVGCNMSYPRDVLHRFRFDEWFDGYGLCEDQDFSYRVARERPLVQTPHARLEHRLSPVGREALPALHEMTAVNHYYFVRKNMPQTPRTWLAFCWSEVGELLSVVKTGDGAAIAGKLRGYRRILRTLGGGPARPVREALS
ncbi:MAG TPA: glycosyltransferase family A protein [Candidatus Binatia bacterium]|jgi:glycosyltransferase involved in cell wall biosynthesis|nr:glycosyltransferase family A protein [Candidatus Binatia bacterium]